MNITQFVTKTVAVMEDGTEKEITSSTTNVSNLLHPVKEWWEHVRIIKAHHLTDWSYVDLEHKISN